MATTLTSPAGRTPERHAADWDRLAVLLAAMCEHFGVPLELVP